MWVRMQEISVRKSQRELSWKKKVILLYKISRKVDVIHSYSHTHKL